MIVSFSACQDTNDTDHNRKEASGTTNKESHYSLKENQYEVNVRYGTYTLTDMYVVSNGIHMDMEYMQTQYIYLESDGLRWYVLSGALWTCRNYDYNISGNKICCVPRYNKGLVKIEFVFDGDKNEIIYEANDVRSIFSYYSEYKPINDDDVFKNV